MNLPSVPPGSKSNGVHPENCAHGASWTGARGDDAARRIIHKSAKILAEVCSNLGLILNCPPLVPDDEIGVCEALFAATSAIVEKNEFARPRLAISQSGKDAQFVAFLRLPLQRAETALD